MNRMLLTSFGRRIGSFRSYGKLRVAATRAACCGSIRALVIPSAPMRPPSIRSWNDSSSGKLVQSHDGRWHSTTITAAPPSKIRLLYGTSGGTSKLFAMQLAEALEEKLGWTDNVEIKSIGEYPSIEALLVHNDKEEDDAFYFFIVSTAGVGEPTSDTLVFYNDLMKRQQQQQQQQSPPASSNKPFRYAIFGLGNHAAHPNHYNVVSKNMQEKLEQLVGPSMLPLALGDDGDCIEDDFDHWQEHIVKYFQNQQEQEHQDGQNSSTEVDPQEPKIAVVATPPQETRECPGSRSGRRIVSSKLPFLTLSEPSADFLEKRKGARDLLDVIPDWYDPNAKRYRVQSRVGLNKSGVTNGLVELCVELQDDDSYEVGDHFLVYPRNPDSLVEAYMDYLNVKPNAVIGEGLHQLPHGLTVYETLSFCVDLSALPSPHFARLIANEKIEHYKDDVAVPRRTFLDLALEESHVHTKMSLEDVLHNVTPMQPRYYSIASSPLEHLKNDTKDSSSTLLTYRPIRYVTKRGVLRQGTCTSYMNNLTEGSMIVGSLRSNPTFRLPKDPKASVVFIAGGCGVAPIRAFLEERLATSKAKPAHYFGPAYLFLGFRDEDDVVYTDLIETCLSTGALTEAHITTEDANSCGTTMTKTSIAWECGTVTKRVKEQGPQMWKHFETGGHTYLCGGARTFGAAAGNAVIDILQEHGGLSAEDATAYLKHMVAEGRFMEDLAD